MIRIARAFDMPAAQGQGGKAMTQMERLVVVSNRLPASTLSMASQDQRSQPVGGLVSAVQSALEEHGGLWFGWSGDDDRTPSGRRADSHK